MRRAVTRLAVAIPAIVGAAALSLAAIGLLARARPADVAIVFGNTVEPDGRPSGRLVARLETARSLYARGTVRMLFVSGGIGREGFDESAVMRDWLVARGVPEAAIVRDSLGINSAATAANAQRWMQGHGARTAVIVTQYFHIARARIACERAGIDVAGAAAPRWFELRDIYSLAREVVATPVYALRR
jgi:vancomycin permeability regulator SanA